MKKHLKLLILVLSLALILGTMAVVISATSEEAQPDTVELFVDGESMDSMTLDDAFGVIETFTDSADFEIKLLGDCSSVTGLEFAREGAPYSIKIDLNGYTFDMSLASTAFDVGENIKVTVTGTGNVKTGKVFADVAVGAEIFVDNSISGAAFSIAQADGSAIYYSASESLSTAIGSQTGITVKLYSDVSVDTMSLTGAHKVNIDLNGYKLSITGKVETSSTGTVLRIYSSVPGGKLVDARAAEGPILNAYNGSQFAIGAYESYPGSNVTLEVRRIAEVSQYGGENNFLFDGITIIAQPTQYGIFNSQLPGGKNGVTIKNSTIICVKTGAGLILTHKDSQLTFDNCDFINLAGVTGSVIAGTTNANSVINFNNCRFGAPLGTSNGTVKISGDCAFTVRPSGVVITDEGKTIGAKEAVMAMPSALGESYTISYGVNKTITQADMPTLKFAVKEGPADPVAFTITDSRGNTTAHLIGEDLNAAISNKTGITVVLYEDCTVTASFGNFENKQLKIDLNGKTLSFDSNWMNILRSSAVYIYSSREGGKIVDERIPSSDGLNSLFEFYFYGGLLQVGTYGEHPGANVTIEAKNFASMNVYSAESSMVIDGATIVNMAEAGSKMISVTNQGGRSSNTATIKNSTVINKVANNALLNVGDVSVAKLENCNFINAASGCKVISGSSESSAINVKDCRFGAPLGTFNCTVEISGNCAFAENPTGATVAQGSVIAYNKTVTGVENMPTLYYIVANEADTTTYNWQFNNATVYSVVAVNGADLTDLYAQATKACTPVELNAIKVTSDGNWTLDGTTFTCGTKACGIKSGLGAVTVTMHEGFGVKFYIMAETYQYLDEASKALFTLVTKDGADLYVMVVGEADVNEAFTDLTFSVKFVEDEYEYTANYKVDVAAYVAAMLKYEGSTDADKAIAYYIAAYLNNAYAFFTENDATEDDLAALAALVEANAALYNADDVARPVVDDAIAAEDKIEIAIDLTATPAFVIKSTVAGNVTFNGKTEAIVAGEELRLTASVLDFDNTLEIALEDGTEGTYCLGNYAAYVAGAEAIEGVDNLDALKALVAAFYDYVIYAENFR